MSFDFKLRNPCDHKVIREELFLEADNQTLLIPRTVCSSDFSLHVNGELCGSTHSTFGYELKIRHKVDETVSTGTDAFLFKPGKEYTLREKDIENSTISFNDLQKMAGSLTTSSYIVTNNIHTDFSLDSTYFHIYKDIESRTVVLCKEGTQLDEGTWVSVSYNFLSTFVESYNFDQYELVFASSIKDVYSYEVSYITDVKNCRKCDGLDYLNDFSLNSLGSYNLVDKTNKLLQDAYVFTLTTRGSDPNYPQMGTFILNMVGKAYLGEVNNVTLQIETRDALILLQKLQRDQSKVQSLDLEEVLNSFKKIEVVADEKDLTKFHLKIRMNSLSENDLEVSSSSRFTRSG